MTTWAEIKTQLRRSILDDAGSEGDQTWSDERIWDAFCWAQRSFAYHTASWSVLTIRDGVAKDPNTPAVVWNLSTESTFPLPSDLYEAEPLDVVGLVSIIDTQGNRTYLDPVFYTRELSPYANNDGFWTAPYSTLHLTNPPGAGTTLEIRYFAYWPEPLAAQEDDDEESFLLTVPRWAIAPILYLTAAHCLVGPGITSANIRQWNTKDDSGNPINITQAVFADWLVKRAEHEFDRHAKQDRTNFFRAVR